MIRARLPTSVLDPLLHLGGGLVGEGDRQDRARVRLALGDQPGDPAGQHPGLARARAGDHQQRRALVDDGRALRLVEPLEQLVAGRAAAARAWLLGAGGRRGPRGRGGGRACSSRVQPYVPAPPARRRVRIRPERGYGTMRRSWSWTSGPVDRDRADARPGSAGRRSRRPQLPEVRSRSACARRGASASTRSRRGRDRRSARAAPWRASSRRASRRTQDADEQGVAARRTAVRRGRRAWRGCTTCSGSRASAPSEPARASRSRTSPRWWTVQPRTSRRGRSIGQRERTWARPGRRLPRG